MGRPVNAEESYKIDMSHQEVERLLEELEEVGALVLAAVAT